MKSRAALGAGPSGVGLLGFRWVDLSTRMLTKIPSNATGKPLEVQQPTAARMLAKKP